MPLHLTLATVLMAMQVPATGTIEGVVRGHEQTAGTLAYATVEAATPGRHLSAQADSLGRYRFDALPAGLVRLRVSHPGHRSARVDVEVPAGGTVSLDVDLERRPIVLSPLRVLSEPVVSGRVPTRVDVPVPDVEVITLALSPGLGEAGLGEAAATLPGNDPANPSDVLFMRGSTTDLKLVLLDGAPVYTPFHLGGLLNSFDAFVLGGAALHVGGAPARYDGGLSYILDLRTRTPRRDQFRGSGGVDLISGHLALEGPLGENAGFTASTRALHDLGADVLGGSHTPYGYRDALVRVDAGLGDAHRLSATAFWNRESVRLSLDAPSSATSASPVGPEDASWGNQALTVAYRGSLGRITLDAAASASGYQAALPLLPRTASDSTNTPEGLLATAETDRLRLTLDASMPLGERRVRFGGSVDQLTTRYGARRFTDLFAASADLREASGVVAGVYVDGVLPLTPGLDVRMGARVDGFSTESRIRAAPRVAFLWSLSSDALLTVAAGRYHQYTRASEEQVELAVSDGASARVSGPLLSVAAADHVVLSLDQSLGSGVRLGIEGFWKSFSGLATPDDDVLRSSGIDLRVLHAGSRATAWLGYNLSWFWSGRTGLSASNFAGRQLLSAGLTGTIDGRTGGSLRVAYSAGLPYTSIPFGSRAEDALTAGDGGAGPQAPVVPNLPGDAAQEDPVFGGEPDDGFLRLDVELFARFNPRIGGRDVEIRPYIRLINALDQRDALFYYFEPWRDDELRPLAQRSVLPVIGMEWRF